MVHIFVASLGAARCWLCCDRDRDVVQASLIAIAGGQEQHSGGRCVLHLRLQECNRDRVATPRRCTITHERRRTTLAAAASCAVNRLQRRACDCDCDRKNAVSVIAIATVQSDRDRNPMTTADRAIQSQSQSDCDCKIRLRQRNPIAIASQQWMRNQIAIAAGSRPRNPFALAI